MKRIARAATLTVASCALVVGGAGAAMAQDSGYTGHSKHASKQWKDDDHDGGNNAIAEAVAIGSPGFLSGNVVQLPINAPINFCGNTLGLGGLTGLSPAIGNVCHNG
ncbi:chaplin [Streptomyces sp. NPDC047108]|uniref:chaplin n=1 Tax=Streptomyces sp. NPDC047108 TaxID=3155025 RepID=UPI0033E590D4